MADPPGDEGFKVTDRRRRDAAEETPARSAAPESPLPPPPEAPSAPQATAGAAQPGAPPEPGQPRPGEPSLVGLFMMLASSALVALGEAPDPMTGQPQRDLGQAAELIDLLLLLRQRTEGNRLPEESQVLDQLLYDLQLRFVNARKRA